MKLVKIGLMLLGVLLLSSAALAQETRGERAELRFLEGMSDHHQMALDMANDCLANAADSALLTLCEEIIEAQSAEIGQMQAWLLDWYNVEYTTISMLSAEAENAHAGHAMSDMPATDPAMMMGMMAGLNRLEGRDYEIAWIESMIDHHDDALHMAERILQWTERDEVRALAEQIISDQTAEIELMETMLVTLAA